MAYKNKEISRFKKRSNAFTKIFSKYREFVNLVDFINSLLTSEQQKILEIQYGGEIIDFKIQLLIYFEDRYNFEVNLLKLKEIAAKVFNKYSFLFDTCLDSNQIRVILLREIMEAISIGSQCFYIWKIRNFGQLCMGDNIREIMKTNYKKLPLIAWKTKTTSFYEKCFWDIYDFPSGNDELKNLWYSEFFKKTKWFLEKLNSCEKEFVNKYRENYYQIACVSINKDINSSHRNTYALPTWSIKQLFEIKINDITPDLNTFLQEIVEEIINHFEKSELEKFKKIDSQGKQWSFKAQLLDRYYSKYPSFVSLEEIKKQIKKKLDKYKPLLFLEKNQSEMALELFMDELEKELFVSKTTHDWNKEMIKNLNASKSKRISNGVSWAIKQILALINYENLEILGKQYDLKTLLSARWKKAWLAQGKKGFNRKLLSIFIKTLHHPKHLKQEKIFKINLQAFLEEIDSCFLFPRLGRTKKFLLNQDDTSNVTKLRKHLFSKMVRNNVLLRCIELHLNFLPYSLPKND